MKHILLTILILTLVALLTLPHATHAQDKAAEADLEALGAKLKAAIASGEMTEGEAVAEYEKATGKMKGAKNREGQRQRRRKLESTSNKRATLFAKCTRWRRPSRWCLVRSQLHGVH